MKKLVIIKTGSTYAVTARRYGDFEEMTRRGLGIDSGLVQLVNAPGGDPLPEPMSCAGVVITGAHCMVTDDLPWSLAIEGWIRRLVLAGTPLLGICYGHQLLGRAMGGQVDFHPRGKEVGTVAVRRCPESTGDPLFGHLPAVFPVHAAHAQSVLCLPPEAVLLAGNDFEPHHAFRLGRCAWGVQFHPEYDSGIMRDYVLAQADALARLGQEPWLMVNNLPETPAAGSILETFARLAITGQFPEQTPIIGVN
jgi:GMP synthase (glutamine-hydrolysing)